MGLEPSCGMGRPPARRRRFAKRREPSGRRTDAPSRGAGGVGPVRRRHPRSVLARRGASSATSRCLRRAMELMEERTFLLAAIARRAPDRVGPVLGLSADTLRGEKCQEP